MNGNITWVPFLALFRREVMRFLKVATQTVFTPIVSSSLYLLIFGISLGQSIQLANDLPYIVFLIPGLVMMAALNNSFQNASSSISIAKFQGELEDLGAAPLSRSQIIWALSLGGLCRGLIVGTITFIVGSVFYYWHFGKVLVIQNPLTLIFFLVGGGLAFAKLGLSVAMWAKNFDQLNAVASFILLPLIYLGGVFFSLEGLHPLWQKLSLFNPLLYFINGVRHGILGLSDVPVSTAMIVTFVTLFLFHLLALRVVRKGAFARW